MTYDFHNLFSLLFVFNSARALQRPKQHTEIRGCIFAKNYIKDGGDNLKVLEVDFPLEGDEGITRIRSLPTTPPMFLLLRNLEFKRSPGVPMNRQVYSGRYSTVKGTVSEKKICRHCIQISSWGCRKEI